MGERSTREIVEAYAQAVYKVDPAALDALLADDVIEDYPQSGERVRGKANMAAIILNYPGLQRDEDWRGRTKVDKVVGEEDRWVSGPDWRLTKIVGTGDHYTLTGRIRYPNGSVWHIAQLVELRNGKIARLTSYFAEAFEAPAWRARWVERVSEPV